MRKANPHRSTPRVAAAYGRVAGRSGIDSSRLNYALLFIAISVIYLATFSDRYFGLIDDGQVMFDTAVSLHEFGELRIRAEIDPQSGAPLQPYRYGKFGLGSSIVLQLPLMLAGSLEKWLGEGRSNLLFPLTNLLITATSALLIALCLRDLNCRFRNAALGAVGYAFATFAWPYVSYDFSEPLQALIVIASFWLILGVKSQSARAGLRLGLAGFVIGFGVLTKATLMLFIPAYAFYLWNHSATLPVSDRLRYLGWFFAPLAIWSAAIAFLNGYRFGSMFDFGYGAEAGQFTTPILTGLYGILLSPNKGLIFYAPLALLSIWSLWRMRKTHRRECAFFISVFLLQVALSAKWWSWEGGASWGPRLLFPILPLLALCAGLLLELTQRAWLPFLACLALGTVINLLGVLIFFTVWGHVVDSHGARLPLDIEGRPAREFIERDDKKWFNPDIAIFYEAALSPIRGHGWLLNLRYFGKPFSIRKLCEGTRQNLPSIGFAPLELQFANISDPITISQLCSAHFWLWDTLTNRPRDGDSRYPLYGIALELQGDRAVAENNVPRALDCYRRSAELLPGFTRPMVKLSTLLFQSGQSLEAKQTLSALLLKYPRDLSAMFALARTNDLTGDRAAALQLYRDMLKLEPGDRLGQIIEERIHSLQTTNK